MRGIEVKQMQTADFFMTFHGNLDTKIAKLLVEFGILVPLSAALIGVIRTSYQIPEERIGVCPGSLTEWQPIRLGRARACKHALDCKEVPALAWIEQSLSRITLPESEQLRKAMQNPRTEHSAIEAMRYLRDYTAPENRKLTCIGYAGTFYTPIMSLPKTVVPTLIIDGEPISQLDITSAHPSTLPRLMIEAEKKFEVLGGIEVAKKLAEELEAGRLYDSLAITLRIDPKGEALSGGSQRRGQAHLQRCRLLGVRQKISCRQGGNRENSAGRQKAIESKKGWHPCRCRQAND
jgi:hypothetical protein